MRPIILVIENDYSYSQYLKKTLIDKGYEVILSKSGLKAIEKIKNKRVDLVISSYYLPNLRGDEFYKQLLDLFPDIPVIFISHEAHKKTIKKILSYSNADYMVKPIVLSELLARIEISLDEHKKVSGKNKLKVGDLVF